MSTTTTLPQLVLISRSIEKKLYNTATSPRAYLNLDTLKLRIAALACAVLIHSEKEGQKSETCAQLLAVAKSSLTHGVMVLVSYETRQLDRRFATACDSLESACPVWRSWCRRSFRSTINGVVDRDRSQSIWTKNYRCTFNSKAFCLS